MFILCPFIRKHHDHHFKKLLHHECTMNEHCPVGWAPNAPLHRNKTSLECPGYDTKQSDGEVSIMQELWGMQSTPSLPSLQSPFWPIDRVLSMGQIEIKCVLILNWIIWNRTVLICKQRTYAQLNCLKWNCFYMLNWNFWYGTVFDIETVLMLKWILWNWNNYLNKNGFGIK